jgi:hypothetical protein
MRKITKRSAAVVGAIVIAIGGGTAAFAYASGWFQGGGTATATSASIKPVTATIVIPGTAHLFPGATVPVKGSVTNPNEYKVEVIGVSISDVTSTKGGANNGGCAKTTADLSAAFAGKFTLAPKQTVDNWTIGSITMGQLAVPQCADSSITATLVFAGQLVA